jgi:hypothetical protein
MYLYICAFALIHFVAETTASRHPHLSVVQTVKEHFPPRRLNQPINSSAAEKRDYVTLTHFRQAIQQNISHRTSRLPPPPLRLKPRRCKEGAHSTHHKKCVNPFLKKPGENHYCSGPMKS